MSGANMLDVNPGAFEQDYEYGRRWQNGRQQAYVLGANVHVKQDTKSRSLHLLLGIASTEGSGKGVKFDEYVKMEGEKYRECIAAIAPEALQGGKVDLDAWTNRAVTIEVTEEVDRIQTEKKGTQVKRPRAGRFLAAAPAPAGGPRL